MISEGKSHLRNALEAAGLPPKRIFDGAAALSDTPIVPRAIIHFRMADERVTKDGTQVAWWTTDEPRRRVYRRRLWRRELDVMVELVGESDVAVDGYVKGFLGGIGYGFTDGDENWVGIKNVEHEWHEDKAKTSSRAACVCKVTLVGGVYEDKQHGVATDLDESGEMEE